MGCQTTHLRYNTVRQAKSLSQIYEQQVMDNIAMTVHDAHALPFFAYPTDGSTNITDTANIAATPFRQFHNVFGINGSRSGLAQWGLAPVSDPDKLALMQCAYQTAVYGTGITVCQKCCDKEKAFEGKPDTILKVYNTITNTALQDPSHCQPYDVVLHDHIEGAKVIGIYRDRRSLKQYDVSRDGTVTIENYDCNGPCAIQCGWICYGSKHDAPHDHCSIVGHHCGTYVWVRDCHRHHLTRLTLKILDYAVNKAPTPVRNTKEVRLWVNKYGEATHDRSTAVGRVTATIGINDPISDVETVDQCALPKLQKAKEESAIREIQRIKKKLPNSKDKAEANRALEWDKKTELEEPRVSDEKLSVELRAAFQSLKDSQIIHERAQGQPATLLVPARDLSGLESLFNDQFETQRQQRALGR